MAAAAWVLLSGLHGRAAEPSEKWLTGRELAQKFADPISLEWSAAPLKNAIGDLARTNHVFLFLDRRVDPDKLITLSVKNRPLGQVCDDLAAKAGVGFCRLEALGYFGPSSTCSVLPTVLAMRDDDVARLPAAARAAWSRKTGWGWSDFATPRELAEELAQSAHAKIEAPLALPHDLWAAIELPPLSVTDRLTLVGAGFDLTFELLDEGRRVRWIPWPERPVVERTYHVGSRARDLLETWKTLAPRSQLKLEGTKIVVVGPVEDHERVAASRQTATRPARPKRPGVQVYTLKMERAPLAELLQVLGRKLDLRIEIDQAAIEKAKIDMRQNVSLVVEQATLDELLEAALKPAGLTHIRKGTTIQIRPAPK